MMKGTICYNDDRGVFCDDPKRAFWADDMDEVVIAKKEDLNRAGLQAEDLGRLSRDEIDNIMMEHAINVEEFPFEGYFEEPKEGEYIVIFTDDSDSKVGDDPYFWDYDNIGIRYWDGSNWKEEFFNFSTDVEIVREIEGKDDRYFVARDGDDFWGCYESDRNYGPARCQLMSKYDQSMSDENLAELIDAILW
ncbi:hypothetical protein [Nitratifractor salsuginis]|uniref:Uncharacterized protein n=1 Tax=Nitratifractor salsuginis (strain DSM 16511 / JCM 12458 / E9I37-1) TaxID=749222 RepID=E6X1L6_NITSE|nr:hypothetical protein [Nitratifractor salsuginis]ADV47007.1 hypothetical protein Nitsa_1761 [Nitratifractor salsuginis DSM 16511]